MKLMVLATLLIVFAAITTALNDLCTPTELGASPSELLLSDFQNCLADIGTNLLAVQNGELGSTQVNAFVKSSVCKTFYNDAVKIYQASKRSCVANVNCSKKPTSEQIAAMSFEQFAQLMLNTSKCSKASTPLLGWSGVVAIVIVSVFF